MSRRTPKRPRTTAPLRKAASALAISLSLTACGSAVSADSSSQNSVSDSDLAKVAAANTSSSSSAVSPKPQSTPSSATSSTAKSKASKSDADPLKAYPMPAAAKAHTHEGAKAFVLYYFSVLDKSDASPRVGVQNQLGTVACTSCQRVEKYVQSLVKANEYVTKDGPVEFRNVEVAPNSSRDTVVVTLTQDIPASKQLRRGSANPVSTGEKQTQNLAVRAVWDNDEWKIDEVGQPSS